MSGGFCVECDKFYCSLCLKKTNHEDHMIDLKAGICCMCGEYHVYDFFTFLDDFKDEDIHTDCNNYIA